MRRLVVAVVAMTLWVSAGPLLADEAQWDRAGGASSIPASDPPIETSRPLETSEPDGILIESAPVEAHRSAALVARWTDRLRQEAAIVSEALATPATTVSSGPLLRQGSRGPRVAQLVQRLAELGYSAVEPGDVHGDQSDQASVDGLPAVGPATPSVFDPSVKERVEQFQADRGLFVDGLVGPQTLGELNRTPQDTLAALSWTIEQMDAAQESIPESFLLINIPSAQALLIRDGEIVLDMQAAVGRPTRRTPLLTDEIVHIVVNPLWTVPPTIMREDVLPRLRAQGDPGISHATVLLDGEVVDPALTDWTGVSPWQITVRQSPGNHNALGRYLFRLTNGQNIFVHDTNASSIFQRAHRWVSSGCVRVSDARVLAEYLATDSGYTVAALDRTRRSGRTGFFVLDTPMPVLMTYWTATVGVDAGDVTYHRDVYNRMRDYVPTPSWAMMADEPAPAAALAPTVGEGASLASADEAGT